MPDGELYSIRIRLSGGTGLILLIEREMGCRILSGVSAIVVAMTCRYSCRRQYQAQEQSSQAHWEKGKKMVIYGLKNVSRVRLSYPDAATRHGSRGSSFWKPPKVSLIIPDSDPQKKTKTKHSVSFLSPNPGYRVKHGAHQTKAFLQEEI